MSAGRIAVVLPSRETFTLRRSGAVALCARDFQRYSRFGGRIDVFGAGACEYPEVSYRRLEGWRRWWRRDRAAYAEAVAEATQGYGLVEVQNRPYMLPGLRRRAPGVKLVLHLHNDPQQMDGSRRRAERARLMEICDAVYCVSDFIRARMVEGLADPAKAVTLLNGAPLPERLEAKTQVVAFTGRVTPIKGVAELVRAFAAAGLDGWRLVIAGGDPKGLLDTLGDERAALGARLELRGQVSHAEAMALLAGAEIAVVPSLWDDPCPRAAIEALAQGCALVTSRRGGLPEIAGDAALFIDPGDTAGFAAALRGLGRDVELRRELQARARARAAEMLDIRVATARLDAERARLLGA